MNRETELTPGWKRALKEADVTLTLPGDIPLTFRRLPRRGDKFLERDEFWMGSRGEYEDEEPLHLVHITQPFYMATFPITQRQFATFCPDHENHFSGEDFADHPADQVNWHEALEFCQWLNENGRDEIPAGFTATLPSEAQWEYACRAGTETEYYTGDGEAALAASDWYDGNSEESTQRVGQLTPNDFGLYDMHGNVEEWCRDAWDAHAYKRRSGGVCDPEVFGDNDAVRVFRGGGWNGSSRFCRAAYRVWRRPVLRFWNRGFRVCLVSGPCPVSPAAEPASEAGARRDAAARAERAGSAREKNLSEVSFPNSKHNDNKAT